MIKLPPFTIHRTLHQLAERVDWGKRNLGVPGIWDNFAGQKVRWAVLDTGVDYEHPDLAEAVVAHKDFTGDRQFGARDRNGHGSHCCGIIGARANSLGVVGVAPACELLAGKVLNNEGSGYGEWIEAGVKWAIDQGADGISMSLGSSVPDPFLERCVDLCNAKGVWLVCAAGNDGRNGVDWPGAYAGSIAVAATDENGDVASFSSRGPEVDVAAPGVNIDSCWFDGGYATISGTCIAEGEYVYTPQGPRKIETMAVGDSVYAQKDGLIVERVVYGVHDRGTAEVHKLTGGGRDVMATASHEMFVFDCKLKEPAWVRLGQLTDRHRLIVPRGLDSQINPYLDATLSRDFCWLVGFFTGDGWISYTTRGMRTNFASGDKAHVIAEVERIYANITGKQLKQNKAGSWHYDDCTRLAMIVDCLGLNHPATEKTIPLWVWSLSPEKQLAFYEGYRTADGHVIKAPIANGVSDAFECASGDLMRRIACLADYRGWKRGAVRSRSRFSQAPSSKCAEWHDSHCLNVYRVPLASGWSEATRKTNASEAESVARSAGIDPLHYTTASHRVLEKHSRTSRVFDLTVPDADCFITHGLVTHNSMATPFASGVGILAISKHRLAGSQIPVTTVEQLRQHLRNTCVDLGETGHDTDTGWGLVNPKTFVGLNPPQEPVPPSPPTPPPMPVPPKPKPKRKCGSKVKLAVLAGVRAWQGR